MAKVAFTKLGLTKNTDVASFDWNGQIVEVKQYLPIQEKMNLIAAVLNNCQDENNFINEAKMALFMDLEVVYRYTNINFTEKQKEDPAKLYDLLAGSGLFDDVFTVLPKREYQSIVMWLSKTADHIYEYRNSIYGIMDSLKDEKNTLNIDVSQLQEILGGSNENLDLLKQVVDKMV